MFSLKYLPLVTVMSSTRSTGPKDVWGKWRELQGPVSVTFACSIGMLLAFLDEKFLRSPMKIEATAVISSILLVMEKGSAERFYITVTYRILGTLAGMSLGLAFSLVEDDISSSYKDTGNRDRHDDDWKLILFRTSVLVPVILTSTLLMKIFPKYAYPLVIFCVQTATGLFAENLGRATSKFTSSLIAIFIAVISVVTFDNITAERMMIESNSKALDGVLSVMELAVRGDPQKISEFQTYSDQVHKSISSAEASIETYAQWKTIRFKKVFRDFTLLVKPLRSLFYQAYSLFWSNSESFRADKYNPTILFCNSEDLYQKYFAQDIATIELTIFEIKTEFSNFFSKTYHGDEEVYPVLDRLIDGYLNSGLLATQERIRGNYFRFRGQCFSTFVQRCDATDYINELALMTIALTEYIRSFLNLFVINMDRVTAATMKLDELVDELQEMRNTYDPTILKERSDSRVNSPLGRSPVASARRLDAGVTEGKIDPVELRRRFGLLPHSETKGGL
jgi:hypothetical protein